MCAAGQRHGLRRPASSLRHACTVCQHSAAFCTAMRTRGTRRALHVAYAYATHSHKMPRQRANIHVHTFTQDAWAVCRSSPSQAPRSAALTPCLRRQRQAVLALRAWPAASGPLPRGDAVPCWASPAARRAAATQPAAPAPRVAASLGSWSLWRMPFAVQPPAAPSISAAGPSATADRPSQRRSRAARRSHGRPTTRFPRCPTRAALARSRPRSRRPCLPHFRHRLDPRRRRCRFPHRSASAGR